MKKTPTIEQFAEMVRKIDGKHYDELFAHDQVFCFCFPFSLLLFCLLMKDMCFMLLFVVRVLNSYWQNEQLIVYSVDFKREHTIFVQLLKFIATYLLLNIQYVVLFSLSLS